MPESLFLIKLRPQACNVIKKETLTQLSSSEFCKISKNTFFTEHLWTTASVTNGTVSCVAFVYHSKAGI